MYDWANSAFATSASTAILPAYFVALFKDVFGPEVQVLGFTLTASSMWSLGIALSTAVVAFTSPVLGAVADRAEIKKTLLWVYTAAGSAAVVLSFTSAYTGAAWAWVFGSFLIANVGFAGGNVFYNSLLPHLASKDLLDEISSRGYAYGYIGGGLLLAVHLALIFAFTGTDHIDLVTRISISSVGLWWFGWALWTFKTVPEPQLASPVDGLTLRSAAGMAFMELRRTLGELKRYRMLVLYIVAFLLFNDGIQTVLTVSGAYGPDTLGVPLVFNAATILIVQVVAAIGAIGFSRLAGRMGAKPALGVALVGWCGVVTLAVGFAPLQPESHEDFDYQLEFTPAGVYDVSRSPDISDSGADAEWTEAFGHLLDETSLRRPRAAELAEAVSSSDLSRFSISIRGGLLDGAHGTGPRHPSDLTQGPIDWWPRTLRQLVWAPLGISVNLQWLILGLMVGLVIGGSQALGRSIFAYMTPETKSGEFFGLFGFIGKASAVFGPMVYLLFTGIYDTRMAILAVLVIIVAGTVTLRWVDVEEGRSVATEEDKRHRAEVAGTDRE
jgi:UMF1 family MFS transporter